MNQINKDKINLVKSNIRLIEETLEGYRKWRDENKAALPDEVSFLLFAGENQLANRLKREHKFLRKLENREE